MGDGLTPTIKTRPCASLRSRIRTPNSNLYFKKIFKLSSGILPVAHTGIRRARVDDVGFRTSFLRWVSELLPSHISTFTATHLHAEFFSLAVPVFIRLLPIDQQGIGGGAPDRGRCWVSDMRGVAGEDVPGFALDVVLQP